MVKRYVPRIARSNGGAEYVLMSYESGGDFVRYEEYAALQAENERLKAVVEAVRAESKSWFKSGGPYMHGCCSEAVDELCEEILGLIDAHKGE